MSKKKQSSSRQPEKTFQDGDDTLHSDVQGSWTGTPLYDDMPVQDADDL